MSKKTAAERGTKRTCDACGSRFYDLNRDPITCPACQAVFHLSEQEKDTAAQAAAERPKKIAAKKPEFVPPEETTAEAGELPPDVEAVEGADAEAAPAEDEQETFLEQEEEDTDVSGFIEGGIEEGGEEEA